MDAKEHSQEVQQGSRFKFGKNWESFSKKISNERLNVAKESLREMLGISDLEGKDFLDIGSGSGLFSLAAFQMGAKVYSMDYDPDSVECTKQLNSTYAKSSEGWIVSEGSVLDNKYMSSLGEFDVVYSWGVLHHTGDMNKALHNAIIPLKEGGKLFIGIYNDQGNKSRIWLNIKKLYNRNHIYRFILTSIYVTYLVFRMGSLDIIKLKNPVNRYEKYKKNRGMSMYHDWIDWLGGLPFEVASPKYIVDFFYSNYGLKLIKIKTTSTVGINEFVFTR